MPYGHCPPAPPQMCECVGRLKTLQDIQVKLGIVLSSSICQTPADALLLHHVGMHGLADDSHPCNVKGMILVKNLIERPQHKGSLRVKRVRNA